MHVKYSLLNWGEVSMCSLMQLNKYLTRSAHAHICIFSADALIWISSLTQTTIDLSEKELNDYPGFGAVEWGFDNVRLYFFPPLPLLKPLVTEQSVWAVTELVQTREKSNDCSSQASCLSAGAGIRRAWIIHKVQISPSLLPLLEFCFCLPT